MKTWIENLEIKDTQQLYPDYQPRVMLRHHVSEVSDRGETPVIKQYVMEMRVGVAFTWTEGSDHEYEMGKERAIIQMHHHLFGDMISDMYTLMNMINAGDRMTAMKMVSSMLDKMGGKDYRRLKEKGQ